MKKIFLAVVLIAMSAPVFSQGGATQLFPPLQGPQGTNVPFAHVTFCSSPATFDSLGNCTNTISVFQDQGLTTPYPSGILTDGLGNFPPNQVTTTALWFAPISNACYTATGGNILHTVNICTPFSIGAAGGGSVSFKSVNGTCKADLYHGADAGAKITAADADTSCNAVDATGLTGNQTAASQITLGRSVPLFLGAITLAVSQANAFNITAPGGAVAIIGIPGATHIVNSSGAAPGASAAMILADYSATSQAADITIRGLNLDGGGNSSTTNCYKRGIIVKNATRVLVENNFITGVEVPAAGPGDAYGINFPDSVTDSKILHNTISFIPGAVADTGFRIPILVQSPIVDQFNGLVAGITPDPVTTTGILIDGNTVKGGTHGINPQNVSYVKITNNTVTDQGQRNIIVYATSDHIVISHNILKNAGSCNVIFDFGIDHIEITDNIMDTTTGGENDNIEGYLQVSHVTIEGNTLSHGGVNAIRIAGSAQNVSIVGNPIFDYCALTGGDGILIEGSMASGYPTLAAAMTVDSIDIRANTIYKNGLCPGSSASQAVQVLGKNVGTVQPDVPMTNIVIDGNTFNGSSFGENIKKGGNAASWSVNTGKNNTYLNMLQNPPITDDYNEVFFLDGTAAPTTQSFAVGSVIRNTAPASGTNTAWVNIAAGTPGTWMRNGYGSNSTSSEFLVSVASNATATSQFMTQQASTCSSSATSQCAGTISKAAIPASTTTTRGSAYMFQDCAKGSGASFGVCAAYDANGVQLTGGAANYWGSTGPNPMDFDEGTPRDAASGRDVCQGSSSAHNLQCSFNNGAFLPMEQVISTSLTTTAATADNVTVTGMASTGHCTLTPTNSGAAGGIASVFVSTKTTNQITVTHTATAGWTFDVECTPQ